MKRRHEGLHGYLKQLSGPGEVAVTDIQPRLPVGPDAALPIGFRPIPTSSQRPKGTNATIVYARTAVGDSHDLGRSEGAPPIALAISEGDVVLTQRLTPATRAPIGENVKVLSVNLMNHDLERVGAMTQEEYEKFFFDGEHFKWFPDGVVNNLDGADPMNEFKDFALANVALQGFCRFSTLPFGNMAVGHNFPSTIAQKGVRNNDRVYLVLSRSGPDAADPPKRTYTFGHVLASHITTAKFKTANVIRAWTLGRVVDGNQSKNMVTLCVGVAPVVPEGGLSVDQMLDKAWLDHRSPENVKRLSDIEVTVLTDQMPKPVLKHAKSAILTGQKPKPVLQKAESAPP